MSRADGAVYLPSTFKIGYSLEEAIPEAVDAVAGVENVVVVSGPTKSYAYAERAVRALGSVVHCRHTIVQSADDGAVDDVWMSAKEHEAHLLVGLGGGGVLDVCKRVQKLYGIPHVAVPTIISNDGLVSPIAVLADVDGVRRSVAAAVPTGLVVDLDIVRAAPRRYLQAAAGDVLSNLSASEDWIRLHRAGRLTDRFSDLAYEMAVGAADWLIHSLGSDIGTVGAVKGIVRAQVFSGLAMSLAGNSRPCSGAEHLLSHAIDELRLAPSALHGQQVGSISLFVLHLLGHPLDDVIAFAKKIELPMDWIGISNAISVKLGDIVAVSRTVRPGRVSVLDDFSDGDLLKEMAKFSAWMGRLA